MTGGEPTIALLFFSLALFLFGIIVLVALLGVDKRNKTRTYRKNVTDLIVVGKMRQYAEEHKIDIEKEAEFFKQFDLHGKKEVRDLDDQIESDLMDATSNITKNKK